jgi:hypothetical protein
VPQYAILVPETDMDFVTERPFVPFIGVLMFRGGKFAPTFDPERAEVHKRKADVLATLPRRLSVVLGREGRVQGSFQCP